MAILEPAVQAANPANAERLQQLIDGNKRFQEGELRNCKADTDLVKQLASGAKPKAAVLSCSDPRAPPELIFDQGLGDLFVIRVAGNLAGPHALGSILFAVNELGCRLVMVLGHTKCAAIGASVDVFKTGGSPGDETDDPIASLVKDILPVVHSCQDEGLPDQPDSDFKLEVAKHNSRHAAKAVQQVLARKVSSDVRGELTIVSALYEVESGAVSILETLDVGST